MADYEVEVPFQFLYLEYVTGDESAACTGCLKETPCVVDPIDRDVYACHCDASACQWQEVAAVAAPYLKHIHASRHGLELLDIGDEIALAGACQFVEVLLPVV